MFFDEDDKVLKWMYAPVNIEIILPNKTITIPNERLVEMEIINDYEMNMFPIFKIVMVLEPSRYYKIIKYKKEVKIRLRIQRFSQENDSQEKSLMRDYISDVFDLILDDDDEDYQANKKRESAIENFKNVEESDENIIRYVDNKIELFLFKRNLIKGFRKNINKVFTNETITNVVKYILNQVGVSKILMTPLDNTKKYEEIMIPKMSCSKALRFIDSYYGLYKQGSLIYFGIERNYMNPYCGKCTAWTKEEHKEVVILIPMETEKHTTQPGVLKKKEKSNKLYMVAEYKTISIENRNETNDVINSNNIDVYDTYTGETDSSDSNVESSGGNSTRAIKNPSENKWISNIYARRVKMNNVVITVRLFDFIPGYLKPNKKITVSFEDPKLAKKYKGSYLISSISTNFIKDGDYLRLSAVATFKKD